MQEVIDSFLTIIGTISPVLFLLLLAIGFVLSVKSARTFVSGVDASRAEAFSKFEVLRKYLANGDPETVNRRVAL
jgi:hypothetical protein